SHAREERVGGRYWFGRPAATSSTTLPCGWREPSRDVRPTTARPRSIRASSAHRRLPNRSSLRGGRPARGWSHVGRSPGGHHLSAAARVEVWADRLGHILAGALSAAGPMRGHWPEGGL